TMLAAFDWDRPIYYAITTGPDAYLNLMEYFQHDGMAYRLVPIKSQQDQFLGTYGRVNTDILFDKLMNVFKYDDLNNPDRYFDQFHMHSIRNYRSNFAKLAKELVKEGKNEKAKQVIQRAMEVLPEETVSFDFYVVPLAEAAYNIGEKELGDSLTKRLIEIQIHDLNYYYHPKQEFKSNVNEKRTAMLILQQISMMTKGINEEFSKQANEAFMAYYDRFSVEAQGEQ
ncbi:MAG: hypothetical protein JXR34_04895, partial [Bacteroidales bacterium]|nr:hypothetical protein [Bacteroidales bacterium]